MAKRRRRGVVLTPEGLEKFQSARLKHEAEQNYGERYTYEKLSELTYLDIHTIKRVIECQEGVDKRTLERIYISFELDLDETCYTKPNPHRRQHWGEAMCVTTFYGRTEELKTLETWLLKDRCRVITVLGMGGMGKTCLTVKLAKEIQERYDMVMWCSLRDVPPVTEVVTRIVEFLSDGKDTAADLPESLSGKINKLIEYLRASRCLIILDNLESVLCDGQRAGIFRDGCEDYNDLLLLLGETEHLSSIILTTREKPKEIAHMEGDGLPVRTFRLYGLAEDAGEKILKLKNLQGTEIDYRSLIEYYGGNALALKVVATTIKELFQGNISEFLKQETAVFGDIRDLLAQQFNRLIPLEREIMYWLAINREPMTIDGLRDDLVTKVPKLKLLEALESLSRRSLVERDQDCFTLQNVVMEYAIGRFLEHVCEELTKLDLELFRYHAIIKATAKDYVRETQIRLVLEPLIEHLEAHYKSKDNVTSQLNQALAHLRKNHAAEDSYAGGNLVNMLCKLNADFTGCDFSNLAIWQADFRNSCFHDVNLAHCNLSKSIFTETFGGVLSVAFSPDGKFLAKGDMNGEVRIYRVSDWQQILSFKGHDDWVTSIAFNSNGNRIATGSLDQTIKLWDSCNGQCIGSILAHEQAIWSIAFGDDRTLASCSDDRTVKIWDINTGECLETLKEHEGEVRSVTFSYDNHILVSGSLDKTVKIWNINTGECLRTLKGHSDGIWSVAVSPDGVTVASASSDQTVRLWNLNSGESLATLQEHSGWVNSVAFSTDGNILASCGWDQTVRLWDFCTGKCIKTLQGHESLIREAVFSPSGQILASVSEDRTLKLWSLDTKNCFKTVQGYSDKIWSVAFDRDNQILVSGSDDKTVKIWNLENNQCVKVINGHKSTIRAVTISPNGNLIATGSDDKTVKLLNSNTGNCSKTLEGHTGWVWSVAFSPDGNKVASGSYDQSVKLWSVSTGQCISTLQENNHGILSVVFSPDGKLLATGTTGQTVKIWDIENGQCIKTLQGHEGWIWSIAFSSDGKTLSSACTDRTVKVWDINTSQCLKTFHGHDGWVWSVAFSPSRQIVASGSTDRKVKLWNVNSGECFRTLEGHNSGILSVAFDDMGHHVISSSEDETIRFWDVLSGKCTKILRSKKPYEGMIVNEINGLTEVKITTLETLGALSLSQRQSKT